MADDVNIEYSVTSRGFTELQKALREVSSLLDEAGFDVNKLESTLQKVDGAGLRKAASETSQLDKNARAASTSMKKLQTQIEQINSRGSARIDNALNLPGAGKAPRVGSSFGEIQDESYFRDRARLTREIEQADIRATAAAQRRSKAEADLARATKRQGNKNEFADWDEQFSAASNEAAQFSREIDGIAAQRYALYDVASAMTAFGAALAGAATYAVVVGASFESAFTGVERTLDESKRNSSDFVQGLRNDLVQLTGEIPLAFQDIANVAQLGNQLGVEGDALTKFTETVARFSAVTGISVEETSLAFGQLGNLLGVLPPQYENLGSAIALVGVNSAATEQQIISVAREIAPAARGAGLMADEVIGLSGALASIRVPAERSRSTILQFFETLNTATAKGGSDLQNFATVVGVTSDELESMVRGGQGMDVLRSFLNNLSAADTIQVTQALSELGLAGLRTNPTIRALTDNMLLLDSTMKDARRGFLEGAELQAQYAKTLDDLSSQWVIFINGLNALTEAITGGAIPSISGLLQAVNGVIFGFVSWLNDNRWAAIIGGIAVAGIGLTGVIYAMRAGLVFVQASLYAVAFAMRSMNAQAGGAIGTLGGVARAMQLVNGSARGAAAGVFTLRSALRSLLVSTGVGAALAAVGFLADKFIDFGGGAEDASLSMAEYNKMQEQAAQATGSTSDAVSALTDGSGGGGGKGGGLKGLGKQAEETAKKVRTLVDYTSDLSGVFQRSGDLRFGSQAAMDEITLAWIKLREEAEEYERTIRTLSADRRLRQYWLGIAEAYNDQVRASELREEIAQIDDKMAEAQRGASTELDGNSRAAIENRKQMRDLLGNYEDYIIALANSGVGQRELQRIISRLNGDFTRQAQSLGYSKVELQDYQARFNDFATIVRRVPRDVNVNVTANTDPAEAALREFFAKKKEAEEAGRKAGKTYADAFNDALGGIGGGGGVGGGDFWPEVPPMPEPKMPGKGWFSKWWDDMNAELSKSWAQFRANWTQAWAFLSASWGGFWKSLTTGEWWAGVIEEWNTGWAQFKRNWDKAWPTLVQGWQEGLSRLSPKNWWNDFQEDWAESTDQFSRNWGDFWSNWSGSDDSGKAGAEARASFDESFNTGGGSGGGGGGGKLFGASKFIDPRINEQSRKEGLGAGTNLWGGVSWALNTLKVGADGFVNALSLPNGVSSASTQRGRGVGGDIWGGVSGRLNDISPGSWSRAVFSRYNIDGPASRRGRATGSDLFGGLSSYFDRFSGSTWYWSIFSSLMEVGGLLWNAGVSLFDSLFGGLTEGKQKKSRTTTRPTGRPTGVPYASGGYTGAGHWLEPAGIVHRGEYVIPKKHVNQRTGLPDLGYVQSLQRSRPAPSAAPGYAGGGFVGGGSGPIELGPVSLSYIGNALRIQLNADGRQLSEATSRGDARMAWAGSN